MWTANNRREADMRRFVFAGFIATLCVLGTLQNARAQETMSKKLDWSVNMTVMETCSCPVFCQCFFTGKPVKEQRYNLVLTAQQ